MFDRNSDYALNKKDPDAIVCKSATGIHMVPSVFPGIWKKRKSASLTERTFRIPPSTVSSRILSIRE